MTLNKQIENVQLEASRIVTGGTRLIHLITFTWKQAGKNLKIEEKNINLFNFTK
jgi:hypothetical protein